MKEEKLYEIFTDASFDSKTKIATYAIVIIQEKKIIKAFAKKCKIQLENSTECEIFAIFQAINIIEANIMRDESIQEFEIRTDCDVAKNFFMNNERKLKIFKENTELYNAIKESYKRVSNKMNREKCSFTLKWIPREENKVAHRYSYSIFKNLKSKEYENNILLFERKKILKFLNKFNSKQCKVLIYLHLIANENKLILKKQSEISESLEISNSSINRIFKELDKLNMLKKVKNGKYRLLV